MKKLSLIGVLLFSIGASCGPPTPNPTPTPTPWPPSDCVCVVPDSADSGWHGATVEFEGERIWHGETFQAARVAIGDVCGKPPDETRAKVIAFFGEQGLCCAVFGPEEFICARPDGLWEAWKATSGANGDCWTTVPGGYKGLWENSHALTTCKGGK